jgi:hypothetical protein
MRRSRTLDRGFHHKPDASPRRRWDGEASGRGAGVKEGGGRLPGRLDGPWSAGTARWNPKPRARLRLRPRPDADAGPGRKGPLARARGAPDRLRPRHAARPPRRRVPDHPVGASSHSPAPGRTVGSTTPVAHEMRNELHSWRCTDLLEAPPLHPSTHRFATGGSSGRNAESWPGGPSRGAAGIRIGGRPKKASDPSGREERERTPRPRSSRRSAVKSFMSIVESMAIAGAESSDIHDPSP